MSRACAAARLACDRSATRSGRSWSATLSGWRTRRGGRLTRRYPVNLCGSRLQRCLLASLEVRPDDAIVRKRSCDAFLDTTLEAVLRESGIDRLIITGCATDYCVDTTVRAALARGWPTVVPADGHTTADRPHLSAAQIIAHHNAIWADFLAPKGPAQVCLCAEIRLST